MKTHRLVLAAAAALSLTGCSKSSPAPKSHASSSEAAAPASPETGGIGAPKIPWAKKTHGQRQDYMGLFVLPRMQELFVAWKPDEYGEFRCQTCHGDGFDKPPVDFAMPRVAFPLDAKDPIGVATKYDAEATRFMVDKVLPTMAKLLGEEPYDEATRKGFSCFRCHPAKGAPRK